MHDHEAPTVLIVRGAGPAGRRIAHALGDVDATAVVLDERTCAHQGVHAIRVPFQPVSQPKRAVQDLAVRYGSFEAMVLLPPPRNDDGGLLGPSWELELGREVSLAAGLLAAAAPALAGSAGVVMPVSAPVEVEGGEPGHRRELFVESSLPALRALADESDLRLIPVQTESPGAAGATAVAERLLEALDRSRSSSASTSRADGEPAGAS
jgi:hypothetical protein